MKKKKKRKIKISAPVRPTLRPEEAIMKAQRKALEEERFKVLEISRRIGKRFGPISVIFGACLLIISFFLTITNTVLTVLVASSPEIKVFFIVLSVLLGIVNAVTGLLLMGCD